MITIASQTHPEQSKQINMIGKDRQSKRKTLPPPRPGVTLFEMVLDIIIALTNRGLVKKPLRTPEQHKKNVETWPGKDLQRKKKEKRTEQARCDALVEVSVNCGALQSVSDLTMYSHATTHV